MSRQTYNIFVCSSDLGKTYGNSTAFCIRYQLILVGDMNTL